MARTPAPIAKPATRKTGLEKKISNKKTIGKKTLDKKTRDKSNPEKQLSRDKLPLPKKAKPAVKARATAQARATLDAHPQALPINIALQGGGAHGAYTWGVLDRLLEDGRLAIEGISGTSAGAMNAVLLAQGLMEGGAEGARAKLNEFWGDLACVGALFPAQSHQQLQQWFGPGVANMASQFMNFDWTHYFSPAQFNPFDINPLRDIISELVDFASLRKQKQLKLFINATSVKSGKIRVFDTKEISLDAVMASACLPMLFRAVEIEGDAYWDGGYSGNPAIFPLIYDCAAEDVLLIQINPLSTDTIPESAPEILDRLNEISFNSTLMREMRAIAFVHKLIKKGKVQDDEYKDMRLHRIASEGEMRQFDAASKMVAEPAMLKALFKLGREAAEDWLKKDFAKVGKKSSMDIDKLFL